MLFRDAKEEGYVIDNPNEFVKRAKITSGANFRRPFTIPELRSVLEIATPEWQSLIKFGLYTGQRLADLGSLTWSNIDTKRGEIRLVTRKRDKTILIPVAGPLQNHILSLPTPDDPKSPIHPEAFGIVAREGRSAKGCRRAGSRRNGNGRARFGANVRPLYARRPRGFGKGGGESARLGVNWLLGNEGQDHARFQYDR